MRRRHSRATALRRASGRRIRTGWVFGDLHVKTPGSLCFRHRVFLPKIR
ncbi:hypothetical protein PATSB16_00520 [Pandoraea thiooxydans]|nr:hypothetical protein PATSB16_00520 [Pandoraea thiooxydans]